MGYQGIIGQRAELTGGDEWFYFGPFAQPDLIRAVVFHFIDEQGTLDLPLRLGLAIFTGNEEPESSRAGFATGRSLVSGLLIFGFPTVELSISATGDAGVRIPINFAFEEGEYYFGVFLNNFGVSDRIGSIYIDTDIGDHEGRKEVT